MEKQKKIYQFKSSRLWKDSIAIGFAIFGGVSAIMGILGVSFTDIFDNMFISLVSTILALLCSYLAAVVFLWWNTRDSVTTVSYTHLDVYKRQQVNEPLHIS